MNYIVSFGIPIVVLVLMLLPFFVLRKKEGWLGDWRGVILRWAIGIGIWTLFIWITYSNFYYNSFSEFDSMVARSTMALFLYFLIWPFFGFNLYRGTKFTKNLIFQLFIGLVNLGIGIALLVLGIAWGLSGFMNLG
ncbi:MAG: hypothetical protein HN964_01920 [Candidatus Jacksonbacteria bacterium]|jgi:hypothetical protein|nr:hypothetical protein [Candidatus Jacksonbacteria bacterium]MBT7008201.1 hypothetical protein [Candidatus Jacksonbacteria bacterium]